MLSCAMRQVFIYVVAAGLVGCTFRIPQLASVQSALSRPFVLTEDVQWVLTLGDYSVEVYPVDTEQGVRFLSYEQDALLFDGFIIRSATKVGEFTKTYTVRDEILPDGTLRRDILVNARVVKRLDCLSREAEGAVALWRCSSRSDKDWVFALTFGDEGELVQIEQPLADSDQVLRLTKR